MRNRKTLDVTNSNPNTGLSDSEVRHSRMEYGENRITRKKRKSFLRSFLESFGDPMIKILLIALAINVIFLFKQSSWFESLGIGIAILLATFVSTLSEYGSESAFERLQEESARIRCRVQRQGGTLEIPVDEVVVGDIVLLQAGDRVPADGIIIKNRLSLDQSALNGESKEAEKHPIASTSANIDGDSQEDFLNPSRLYSGTIVCEGEGAMRVTQVGDHTVYGRIGAEIQEETRESPLRIRLTELASGIGKLSYLAALFSALAFLFNAIVLDNHFDTTLILSTLHNTPVLLSYLLRAATLAVTVIVMAVPEGLPMMITVVLSANMKRMLRDNVLVRKLTGIETAGELNILFTDKTGTLTHGKPQVIQFISGIGKTYTKTEARNIPNGLRDLLQLSITHNSAATLSKGKPIGGNATDRAALAFAAKLGERKWNLTTQSSIPFSSNHKFMATTVSGKFNGTLIKGAPEKILPHCTGFYGEDGTPVSGFHQRKLEGMVKNLADKAVRIIAIAVSDTPVSTNGIFKNLKLIGLLGIRDDVRRKAIQGVHMVQEAGIQVVMITGDSSLTATAIAKEAGLIRNSTDLILTSEDLRRMSDAELTRKLPCIRVVARALPADKSRLVRIAQGSGLVVGMTGDGVNDAPALKQADVGFSMGSGTEIAKEAGDIVILDDNFASIANAICYGRTIFKSIRKFVIYQVSICMCAVGISVIGPMIGVDSPITVIQMLWINIVMDTLAGLAFSGEVARKAYMKEPPKSRNEPIINSYMRGQIASNSIYLTILCLFFLKSSRLQAIFGARGSTYMMTAFFALFMFSAIFTSFCARTHRANLLSYLAANKPFIWIMGIVSVVQVFLLYYGGSIFRTTGLDLKHLILVIFLAFSIIPVDILRKRFVSKRSSYAGT